MQIVAACKLVFSSEQARCPTCGKRVMPFRPAEPFVSMTTDGSSVRRTAEKRSHATPRSGRPSGQSRRRAARRGCSRSSRACGDDAAVAQLVECLLAEEDVAGSSPVGRSVWWDSQEGKVPVRNYGMRGFDSRSHLRPSVRERRRQKFTPKKDGSALILGAGGLRATAAAVHSCGNDGFELDVHAIVPPEEGPSPA